MKHLFLLILLVLSGSTFGQIILKDVSGASPVSGNEIKKKGILRPQSDNQNHNVYPEFKVRPIEATLLDDLNSPLRPGIKNDRNVPSYIEGVLSNTGARSGNPESVALEYLTAAAPLMKIKNADKEFAVLSTEKDDLGMTHVRMRQQVNNIPVYGTEVIIHGKNLNFDFLNGTYYPTIENVNTIPSKDKSDCLKIVESDLNAKPQYKDDVKMLFKNLKEESQLIIYPYEGQFYLAYHTTTYKNLIDRWEYFVDAHSGKILNKYQSICKFHNHIAEKCTDYTADGVLLDGKTTANALDLFNVNRQINTYQVGTKYYLIDGAREIFASTASSLPNDPNGVIWTIDAFNTSPEKDNFNFDHITSTNNTWTNKTGVSAHYNGGKSYEYFFNTHNRKSINGQGGNIISLINVADDDGSSMGNAFWNGQAMFYGNGDAAFLPLARGLDVAGHEMSHGVIESTANLEYQGESGALNESFADVFGTLIDRDDWKIGEDVVKTAAFPSGALRSMDDPHNGAATNDFNKGWQPRTYDERYKGSEDNGGVHVNSGIPNWAFYKFATAVSKEKAEKVYYRALSNYLTKSSKFVDCRVAIIKAATDLYTTTEVNAAKKAFDEVGILGEVSGNYQNDAQVNPGQEYVISTGPGETGIFLFQSDGKQVAQLTTKKIINKPSVSDDGSIIVYVGADKKVYYCTIDWVKGEYDSDKDFDNRPLWANAVISKDGTKVASLYDADKTMINVYDAVSNTESDFTLYNPTYTQGVSTGDVLGADAMEFDVTGEYIMYDAANEIKSATAGTIEYWDIGFIKVWNNATKTFSLGNIDKLYSSLPKNVSIGNPTFSKNSPYIIAFDYIANDNEYNVLGANIETGKSNLIIKNNDLGFPNFSSKDNRLVFEEKATLSTSYNVKSIALKSTKIEPATATASAFLSSKRWAIWFSNGKRVLSGTNDAGDIASELKIIQNPASDMLKIELSEALSQKPETKVFDLMGKLISTRNFDAYQKYIELPINDLHPGIYVLSVSSGRKVAASKFVKN